MNERTMRGFEAEITRKKIIKNPDETQFMANLNQIGSNVYKLMTYNTDPVFPYVERSHFSLEELKNLEQFLTEAIEKIENG